MTKRKLNWKPTPRQKQVLHLLAGSGAMTAKDVERAYLGIPQSTATSIFSALGDHGLVDVSAGGEFIRGRYVRAFALTQAGVDFEASLLREDEDA